MKTVVWGNYKGGVGKTTSVFQVAAHFASKGKKVLLLDFDPQCSLSHICCSSNGDKKLDMFKSNEVFNYVLELYMRYINSRNDFDFSLLKGEVKTELSILLENIIIPLTRPELNAGLFYIPSSVVFENCRLNELAQRMEGNIFNIFMLHLFNEDIKEFGFDYVFIDCPPTSNLLVQSAFLTSDYYIVPTIIDEISAKGVADYIFEIEKTRTRFVMKDEIGSILLNKVCGDKIKLIGVFETIYKERTGKADNRNQVITLDKTISSITDVKSLLSEDRFKEYRYSKDENGEGFETLNILSERIPHKDSRSTGNSVPMNTAEGRPTESYITISQNLLEILEESK